MSIGNLADSIDERIREYCGLAGTEARFDPDSDSTYYEPAGDSLRELLETELEVPFDAASDLATVLIDTDPADIADGEDVFYSDTESYARIDLPTGEYGERWDEFAGRVKHERRFFDEETKALLQFILGSAGSAIAAALPTITLGPAERVKEIYRARRAETRKAAEMILAEAETALGRPSKERARAGRMNAAGIPVFYGAISEDVALAEVRPSVGSFVITGRFTLRRELRLLDLSRIDHVLTGSIFHPDYENRASRLRFLEGFHHLIARPVQPEEEPLEYIPTQAVAEYAHNVLGFDGILYGSAQTGVVTAPEPGERHRIEMGELTDEELQHYNVVLFGPAGATTDASGATSSIGLTLDAKGVRSHMITGVTFSHEWTYVGPQADDDLGF